MKGAALLTSVIIVGAVALTVAFGAASLGLGSLKIRLFENQSETAFFLADACGEEALIRLKRNSSYAGGSLTFTEGTCS